MIKLSIGSAIELGLSKGQSDIPPTTAYIMIGNKCMNNCSFCSQSIESSTKKDRLSRVVWPEYSDSEIIDAIKNYKGKNIKRICIQSMASDEALISVEEFVKKCKQNLDIPISLSAKLEDEKDVAKFFDLGIEKIGIAIDCANKKLYEEIKGNNFEEKLNLISSMGNKYRNKISTHIIVGMGETHEDIFDIYSYFRKHNVTVSLFAFTPVRGTKMQSIPQPDISDYRKVQLITYLIENGYKKNNFEFEDGKVINIKDIQDLHIKQINIGKPFEIRGCKDCNRPYYNERPGGTIYNYSRELRLEEMQKSLQELNLDIGVREIAKVESN